MKIIDETTEATHIKPSMFLHGVTGNGKTNWSFKGGKPLGIVLEPKAINPIRKLNPAAVLMCPECLKDLTTVMALIGDPDRMKARGIDRIILDSYTGLTEVLPAWIRKDAGGLSVLSKALEIQEYDTIGGFALAIVEAIQLTGYPSVIQGRSVSKKIGLSERIVPDSVGKSVNKLPGRLLPTAEARIDPELGFVIDTTPVDYSQRCGLPWLPQIVRADEVSCLEYLQMVEGTTCATATPEPATAAASVSSPVTATSSVPPAASGAPSTPPAVSKPAPSARASKAKAPAPEPETIPGADDPEWVDLLTRYTALITHLPEAERSAAVKEWGKKFTQDAPAAKQAVADYLAMDAKVRAEGIDPEADPEGYRKAFGLVCQGLEIEKRAQGSVARQDLPPEVIDFADDVAQGNPPAPAVPEEVASALDACTKAAVSHESLWKWAISKGQAKASPDGSKNWTSLTPAICTQLQTQLSGSNRAAFVSWLIKNYPSN